MDILSFAKALDIDLFPVQKVVLKLLYGLPLDNTKRTIGFPSDWTRSKVEWLTEAEYVARLYAEGRCGVKTSPRCPVQAFYGCIGRRGGKSLLSALVMAFEAREVTLYQDPPCVVTLATLGVNLQMALQGPFGYASELVRKDPALAQRMANDTKDEIRFQTGRDLTESGPWAGSRRTARASVSMCAKPVSLSALRGENHYLITLDEFAHFPRSSAREMSEASRRANKALILSTPKAQPTEFEKGFVPERPWIQIPTWEINPHIDPDFLKDALRRMGRTAFVTEYGAQFSRTVEARIPADLHRQLMENAQERGVDISEIISDALQRELARM